MVMAITTTPRLGLPRWAAGGDEWPGRTGFDEQNLTLDDIVAIDLQGDIADRPAAGVRGRYFFAEDQELLYRDDGDGWNPVGIDGTKLSGIVPLGAVPNLPASRITSGTFATARIPDLDAAKVASGTLDPARIPNAINPVGAVVEYAGGGTPAGWLLCNGSAVSRTAYPALYAAIGVRFGAGDGSTTFNLPDYDTTFAGSDGSYTSGVAAARSGWSLSLDTCVIVGNVAHLRVEGVRTGGQIAQTAATGNISPDNDVFTVSSGFRPRSMVPIAAILAQRVFSGYLGTDGVMTITAASGDGTNIMTGDGISLGAVYNLSDTGAPTTTTHIIRAA